MSVFMVFGDGRTAVATVGGFSQLCFVVVVAVVVCESKATTAVNSDIEA
jgi:hypothetical protein